MRRVPTPEDLQAVLSLPQFSARARMLEKFMAQVAEAEAVDYRSTFPDRLEVWGDPAA